MGHKQTRLEPERRGVATRCTESEILSLTSDTWKLTETKIEFLMISASLGFVMHLCARG